MAAAARTRATRPNRLDRPDGVRVDVRLNREIICCDCGDDPYLHYSQLSPRLQKIRGPYTIATGLAAYEKHLGVCEDLTVPLSGTP